MRTIITAIAVAGALMWWTAPGDAQQEQRTHDGSAERGRQAEAQGYPARGLSSDDTIEDIVYARLLERLPIAADVRVSADRGTVTITGTVPSEEDRRRALRLARRTDGVMAVQDLLRVDTSRGATTRNVDDGGLARRVAEEIARAIPGARASEDWWLAGWRVEGPDNGWNLVVEADNGTVWLEGEVPRHSVIRTALQTARRVDGVRAVRNLLDVEMYDAYGAYHYGYPFAGYPSGWGYGPLRPQSDR